MTDIIKQNGAQNRGGNTCKNKTKQMEGDEELTEMCEAINVFGTSKLQKYFKHITILSKFKFKGF